MSDLYNTLKIIHILSGALVFCVIVGAQSYWLWWAYLAEDTQARAPFADKLSQQTLPMILIGAMIQILTGFTLISLHHITWHTLWIKVAFIGILLLLANWGLFIALLSQQRARARYIAVILWLFSIGLLSTMIYFMANQIK